MNFETIQTRTEGPDSRQVAVITLNRPKQLNALNDPRVRAAYLGE